MRTMTARGSLHGKTLQLHGCTYYYVSGAHCQLKNSCLVYILFSKNSHFAENTSSTVLIGVCSFPLPVKL